MLFRSQGNPAWMQATFPAYSDGSNSRTSPSHTDKSGNHPPAARSRRTWQQYLSHSTATMGLCPRMRSARSPPPAPANKCMVSTSFLQPNTVFSRPCLNLRHEVVELINIKFCGRSHPVDHRSIAPWCFFIRKPAILELHLPPQMMVVQAIRSFQVRSYQSE